MSFWGRNHVKIESLELKNDETTLGSTRGVSWGVISLMSPNRGLLILGFGARASLIIPILSLNFKALPLAPLRDPGTTILTIHLPSFHTSSIVSCLCSVVDSNILRYMLTCLNHP